MLTCNKIYFPNRVTSFWYFEAVLLSLNKVFSYCFSIRQRAKHINFNEIIAIFQAIARWIKIFKSSQLHVFCDNFRVVCGVQKTFIKREAIQSVCKMAMFCAKHDIEIQAHWILIKQNSFADRLSHGQYTIIANKYLSLQIAQSSFGICLKADIKKSLLNKYQLVYFGTG